MENNIVTTVTFSVKNEPIIEMISKEFKGKLYELHIDDRHKIYTQVTLFIAEDLKVYPDDEVMLNGYKVQFETITKEKP